MTIAVDLGRKANKQTNKQTLLVNIAFYFNSVTSGLDVSKLKFMLKPIHLCCLHAKNLGFSQWGSYAKGQLSKKELRISVIIFLPIS